MKYARMNNEYCSSYFFNITIFLVK